MARARARAREDTWLAPRANLYFAAILEIDGRGEHNLVAAPDAGVDFDLGAEIGGNRNLVEITGKPRLRFYR
jgi:hypothetical protein